MYCLQCTLCGSSTTSTTAATDETKQLQVNSSQKVLVNPAASSVQVLSSDLSNREVAETQLTEKVERLAQQDNQTKRLMHDGRFQNSEDQVRSSKAGVIQYSQEIAAREHAMPELALTQLGLPNVQLTKSELLAETDYSVLEEICQELGTANQLIALPCRQLQKIACVLIVMLFVAMKVFTHLGSPRSGVGHCGKSGKNRLNTSPTFDIYCARVKLSVNCL